MRKGFILFAVYLVLGVLITWPLSAQAGTAVIDAGDPLFYAWNISHNWQSLFRGFRDLLNTNIYYPTTNTLAFADTLFTQSFLLAPVLAITNNPVLAENLYILLSFPFAAYGAYLLLFALTASETAAFCAGIFFAFSPVRLVQISHLPMISSSFLPYILWSLHAYLRTGHRRDIFIHLAFLALTLGASIYLGVFALITSLLMVVWFAVTSGRTCLQLLANRTRTMLPFIIPFLIILTVLLMPYIRLKIEHPEIRRSIEEAATRGAYQEDYATVMPSALFLSRYLPTKEDPERVLYPTLTLLVLAFLAMLHVRHSARHRPDHAIMSLYAILAFLALILSFGPSRPFRIGPLDTGYLQLPYAYLYHLFPPLQLLRVPARFSIIFVLAMSVLAGITLKALKPRWLALLMVLPFLLEIWPGPLKLVPIPVTSHIPAAYRWMRDQPVTALAELPIDEIENGTNPIPIQVRKSYEELTAHDPLATEAYRTYFSAFHQKPIANGYSGLVPQSYHDLVGAMKSFPQTQSLDYLSRQRTSHILIHAWQYDPSDWTKLRKQIEAQPRLSLAAQFGEDRIYTLISGQ